MSGALHVAWLATLTLGSVLAILGVVTHPWRHWLDYSWWWLLGAATSAGWAGQYAWDGHIFWAVFDFLVFLGCAYVVVTDFVVAEQEERVSHRG